MNLLKKVTDGVAVHVQDGVTFISSIKLLTAAAAITECSIYNASMYKNDITNPLTNLVTNGDFSSTVTTEWGAATGWAQSGTKIGHTGGTTALTQDLGEASGDLFSVTFTVSGFTAGTIQASIGGVTLSSRAANGTFTELARASGNTNFALTPNDAFRGSLSNIEVYKVGDATDIVDNYKLATANETKSIVFSPDPLYLSKGCICFITGSGGEANFYG